MEPRTLDTESLLLMLIGLEEKSVVIKFLWWRVVLYSCDRCDAVCHVRLIISFEVYLSRSIKIPCRMSTPATFYTAILI